MECKNVITFELICFSMTLETDCFPVQKQRTAGAGDVENIISTTDSFLLDCY